MIKAVNHSYRHKVSSVTVIPSSPNCGECVFFKKKHRKLNWNLMKKVGEN